MTVCGPCVLTRSPCGIVARMRVRILRIVVAVAVAAFALACGAGRNVARGVNAYNIGDYQTAMSEFLAVEHEFTNLSPRKQFDYALYRGLTHLQYGDGAGAQYWLMQARMIAAGNPSVMRGGQQYQLEQGLARLQMMAAVPQASAPQQSVVVQPQAAAPPASEPAPARAPARPSTGGRSGPVVVEQSQSGGDQVVAQ